MAIDGKLYREAQEAYQQWELAERAERADNAGKRTPLECWRAVRQVAVDGVWSALRFRPAAMVGK